MHAGCVGTDKEDILRRHCQGETPGEALLFYGVGQRDRSPDTAVVDQNLGCLRHGIAGGGDVALHDVGITHMVDGTVLHLEGRALYALPGIQVGDVASITRYGVVQSITIKIRAIEVIIF